ncbi:hypothetical protein J7L67_01905 [bacterium]|nr:hypothetical protein [bacterium]
MLVRKMQLAAKVEDIEGGLESLASVDAKFLVKDPNYSADMDIFEREIVRDTLSNLQSLTGKKSASLSFGLELRGSGSAGTAPQWSRLLKACGFQENILKSLTIGIVSDGPFVHGETITQSTTNATGRVVIDTANGTTTLYFVDTGGGTWDDSNDITGGTSGATATPSALATAGIEWKPFSDELSQISIGSISNGPFSAGELITGGTSGAKGYVYEETATGASVLKYRIISGVFTSGETVTGSDSGASATTSSTATQVEVPSLSMGLYNDGFLERLKGGRGTVKFTFPVGRPAGMDFEFKGAYVDADDVTELTGISYETTVPPVVLDASLSVNKFAAVLANVEIDVNNTVSPRESVNDSNGILSHRITERKMTGSIDPEMVLKAQQDFYQQLKNNTEVVIDFTVGNTTGNMFRIYVPRAQYNGLSKSDRDGIRVADLTFSCNGSMSPGDDELTLLQL